jgi:hypothetical protein
MAKVTDDYINDAEGELALPFPPYNADLAQKDLDARKDAIDLATLDALQAIAAAILALARKR